MRDSSARKRNLIEGRPALVVIDIQASTFIDKSATRAIDNMPGYAARMAKARVAIDGARSNGAPQINES